MNVIELSLSVRMAADQLAYQVAKDTGLSEPQQWALADALRVTLSDFVAENTDKRTRS